MNIPKLVKTISELSGVFASRAIAKERRYAEQSSHELLALFNALRAEQPNATPHKLYVNLICKRTGASEADGKVTLRQVQDSFTAWPVERAVNLRDVASFLIISAYLTPSENRVGTRSDMVNIVQSIIPEAL